MKKCLELAYVQNDKRKQVEIIFKQLLNDKWINK